MQNEQLPMKPERAYGNYFDPYANNTRADNCAASSIVHHNRCSTSPNRAQKLTQNIQQRNSAISSPRRSIHVEDPRLLDQLSSTLVQQNKLLPDSAAYRTNYRAPSLRTNGRSLSARDSQEEFQLVEKMNTGQSLCAKRLLPVTPLNSNPRLSTLRQHNRLSFDVSTGAELVERRLQDQLVVNETLFQRSKDKSPTDSQQRFAKRSQSPNVAEPCADSNSPQPVNSPKRVTEVGQPKQLLQGCSRRLNFQRLHQKSLMGQENSRPPSKSNSSFSNSFDSSTVYSRPNVNLASTRADSTASDDGTRELHLNAVKTPHASSTGSIQVETNQPVKQKRSMAELYSSSKIRSNTLNPSSKGNGSKVGHGKAAKKTSQSGISSSAQAIINFCVENAKGDISTRVINRMVNKREDFAAFINNLSPKQYNEFANSLREFFASVVTHLESREKICEISSNYGVEQVQRRAWGFKADYFSLMANELTTECVFLDGAQHQTTDAIQAWSELTTLIFASVRDGYYDKVRFLRKNSHCFKSMYSQSSDVSNEETPTPSGTPKITDTHFN